MKAELINFMGDDLTVVNAAKVSFDKESKWEIEEVYGLDEDGVYSEDIKKLSDKDKKLINYLARHDHFTPFTHSVITLRETVPIFVARQR
ncbi:MAG: FAD-dependent thymidylate synthase [Microcystis sp. M110S1]|uniref:FAD-dependent thymidylate synthase n=1 Tax=Microcystis sp. M110S1 TaxID=2771102 RepID=UPI002588BB38|nr:FAD-dependent thymidylate synthase [Microcystis sp. M110S1]MCA2973868.1 FAD-dependent thymidylate synthase [Microcystis sp. M110S1]